MSGAARSATPVRVRTRTVVLAVVALVAAMVNVVGVATSASATDPDNVGSTLEGCKNDGTITLPNGSGKFICPDSVYTSGNLGKGWNELDLVPYRVIMKAGNAAPSSQTWTIAYAVDAEDAGHPGYDVLSVATLNTALSSATCTVGTSGPDTVMTPGLGGIAKTRFRTLEATQLKNTTCVYDYYARLALGSHLFPGSSLHANLALPVDADTVTTSGIGASDVSIPVKEIAPQTISKTMAASQNSNHLWSVSKSPTPANLPFGNSCVTATGGASLTVNVTVAWTKGAALATGYTVTTNVYATNPAARVITVDASDVIKSGSTILDSTTFSSKDVPANTANFLLGTHTANFTLSQVPGSPDFNDVATAAYTDKVTGVAVPGTTTATASVANNAITTGTTTNDTATVTDTESITGSGLTFSVAEPSVGAFTNYTKDTPTTGPVNWSAAVNSSGSVTFAKTVYLDQPRIVTGSLDDTATVAGTDSGTNSAGAKVSITSGALVALTINKTLSPASSDAQSFTFNTNGPDSYTNSSTLSFPAGTTSQTTTLTDLAPGGYSVVEPASGPFPGGTKSTTITLPTCSGSVDFTNTFTPPKAQVRKVTVPAGSESGWKFTLTGTGIATAGLDVTTTGTGAMEFPFDLQTGSYAITETTQDGWDLTGVSGTPSGRITGSVANEQCTFTVSQINDASTTFECVFTNTARGKLLIDKVTDPAADPQSFAFTLTGGPSTLNQSFDLTDVADPHSSGAIKPGSGYSAAETVPAGWDQTGATCDDGSPVTNIAVSPGETVTCTFTNTKRGHIIVHKITDPAGSTASFDFTLKDGPSNLDSSFSLKDGEQNDSGAIKPGSGYKVAETVPDGWDLSTATCSDNSPIDNIDVAPGETVHCYFTNTQRGVIIVDKVTVPAGDPEVFGFTLTGGTSALNQSFGLADATTPWNSGFVKPGSGYNAAETVPTGWDLTSATCSDGSPVNNISVSSGETVVCTFTDTKRASIIVDKVTLPSGSPQSFSFGLTGGPTGDTVNQSFDLTDTATPHDSGPIRAGTYAAAETVPTGWDQTSATCDDGSPVSAIDLAPGETVTCTFTNTQRGQIRIDKVTVPSGATQVFDFAIQGGPSALDDTAHLADATTPYSSGLILPGSGYSAAETPVAGWDLTSATCNDSNSTVANIDVSPGETVTCTFTNTKRGKIIVDKVTDPAGYPQSFDFTVTGGPSALNASFALADTTTPYDTGAILPGSGYAAAETVPTGWTQTSATCDDGSPVANIAVSPGETVTCTFRNKARGRVDLLKTLNGGPIPAGSSVAFTFQLRQGASAVANGSVLETVVVNASNSGSPILFGTELIPGQSYQMCEIVMPAWSTTLGTFVPQSFNPPDGTVPNPNVDNSILCGNFTAGVGTFHFTVDNTPPPGGRALTIGFWKNWASCANSNGGKKPVLDQTLAAATAAGTGIVVSATGGTYPGFGGTKYLVLNGSTATPNAAPDCSKAVALLNKSNFAGKKLASDPAFNLAAQLVAAELNYAAGAGKTGTATTAITQAVLILGKYHFDGTGYTGKISAADATTMNNLATILDNYNNNRP